MAKQRGFLKIEGKLDDISFFKRKDEFLLRQKGGVSKHRIMNDPRFKRTRENGTEFGMIAKAGKMLRDANAVMINKAHDGLLHNRLMQVMSQIKACDVTSPRGERQVYVGLGTAEGKEFLKGFEFNSQSSIRSVLSAPYALVKATGKVTIADLLPAEQVSAPPHATHVSFRAGFLKVNFETGDSAIAYSPVVNLSLEAAAAPVSLTPTAVPANTGTVLYLLLVEFYQEMNGVQYVLSNGNFNSLTVLDVA
ncbi:MAG: hypothetical protein CFE23_16625 [Flavobacterium sp. BFFFF1]|uniref:hypothetical protein n=1 Tax=unclassified Flavobacterium TaxID=196869 RepID=UPI000BD286AC|nr:MULTISPECIES: hypothetical protein [unclassified Flavobacterium]OYU78865.1 MAG: hypothetical protein CFE23_16625 [Flavobacterium sp. BFFFF1]